MARLLVVVPSNTDPPARLGQWLREAGLELDERRLGADDELPADLTGHDGLLVLGTPFALRRGYDFSVSFLGKAATWVLYASIAFILVTDAGTDWPLALFWSGVALASLAGILYGVAVWKAVRT